MQGHAASYSRDHGRGLAGLPVRWKVSGKTQGPCVSEGGAAIKKNFEKERKDVGGWTERAESGRSGLPAQGKCVALRRSRSLNSENRYSFFSLFGWAPLPKSGTSLEFIECSLWAMEGQGDKMTVPGGRWRHHASD